MKSHYSTQYKGTAPGSDELGKDDPSNPGQPHSRVGQKAKSQLFWEAKGSPKTKSPSRRNREIADGFY